MPVMGLWGIVLKVGLIILILLMEGILLVGWLGSLMTGRLRKGLLLLLEQVVCQAYHPQSSNSTASNSSKLTKSNME